MHIVYIFVPRSININKCLLILLEDNSNMISEVKFLLKFLIEGICHDYWQYQTGIYALLKQSYNDVKASTVH